MNETNFENRASDLKNHSINKIIPNYPLLFIVNLKSANFKKKYFESILKNSLSENKYKIYYTDSPDQLFAIIEAHNNYHIIICGGDGTIFAALPAIVKFNKPFSIIPCGTSNVLCKELNISTDIKKTLYKIINSPEEYKIDVVKTDKNKYFILMCGIGYDALAVKTVNLKFKKIFHKSAYLWSGFIAALKYNGKRIKLKLNNNEYIYKNMLIGNCKKYAGNFNLFFNAKNNDGLIDIIGFKRWNFFIAAIIIFFILIGKIKLLKIFFDYFQTEKFEIELLDENIFFQLDGDFVPEQLTIFENLKTKVTIIK